MVGLGALELTFIGLVAAMTAAVGAFSAYVILQQFRNPGRGRGRRGR